MAIKNLLMTACLFGAALARAEPAIRESLKSEPLKIAYEAYADGNSDIWTMNADGSRKVNLTHSPDANEHYPQVSGDGAKIAFTVDTGEGRDAVRSLWVMDVDGGNRKRIADGAREPFWSPDGKTIGYLPQEYPKFSVMDFYTKGMVFYHLETGASEPHPNAEKLKHLYHPRFTPDGRWIVATVHGGMGFGHAILAIEAHGDKVVDLKIPGCRPTVSPDGKYIAWGSSDHQLITSALEYTDGVPHVGKPAICVQDDKNKIYHIAWSPDGKYVAFSRGPDGEGDLSKAGTFQAACEIIGVYAKDWNLYAVRADRVAYIDLAKVGDDQLVQLTSDGNSNKEPFWFRASGVKE